MDIFIDISFSQTNALKVNAGFSQDVQKRSNLVWWWIIRTAMCVMFIKLCCLKINLSLSRNVFYYRVYFFGPSTWEQKQTSASSQKRLDDQISGSGSAFRQE